MYCEGTGKPRIRATIAAQPVDHGEGVVQRMGAHPAVAGVRRMTWMVHLRTLRIDP